MPKKPVKSKHFLKSPSSAKATEGGGFDLPKVEEQVLAFWKNDQIFEKSILKRKGKKTFVFFEGPPYANGKPGIHHVLARVYKDIILRYKTMRGFNVPRKAGWDTHGLPVEIAAEKALGLKTKADIERFGIQKFNEEAKKAVWMFKDEWEHLTERIGYWLDLKNAYVTYSPEFIESVWWSLAQISRRGLLYRGHKVVPWCSRCGTALSSHELAQGYKEVEDNSVYLRFRLRPGQNIGKYLLTDGNTYILSWTTTPWTLPGNVALAVGEDIRYAVVQMRGSSDTYILAEDLVQTVLKDVPHEQATSIIGSQLLGVEYEPLFDVPSLRTETSYKVYPANFVTTTDGTGVVHTAVMYGEDDYRLGIKIGLPQRHTVTEEGRFSNEVPDVAGKPVKARETEEAIFEHLKKNGTLLRTEKYAHEYPHCWRCGTPVLYYARTSWFIEMSKLRDNLLKNNQNINWVPEHIKEGRFGEWLREVKDWNLSRERYWGAPLPIWECKECRSHDVIGSMAELSKKAGGPRNRYYVMRHGEAQSNVKNVLDSGGRALHLTAIGRDQVKRGVKKLKNKKIDLIVASDILRTAETASISSSVLGVNDVVFEPRLREINLGKLSGKNIKAYNQEFPTLEDRFEKRPEGGESLRDLRARVWETLQDLEKQYEGKNILLVTHEYVAWMLFHVGAGWSEKKAREEKLRRGNDFVKFAEPTELPFLVLPRDPSGLLDPHRPFIDGISLSCYKCGSSMRRIPEVADVWYDSGSMPFSQQHYPFENRGAIDKKQMFPADYISEGIDQTRGWFYTMLAIATALGHTAPYKNVVCLGLINDRFGQKMSKSKGNIVEPFSVIDKYGVDAVRWYFYSASEAGDTKNFDEAEVGKVLRRVHMIIYNSLVFWQTYADKTAPKPPSPGNVLDRWILARLAETTQKTTEGLERYQIREAAMAIETLVDDLSRWYIRRSRRRLQKPESKTDYRSASGTLAYVLREMTMLMAPFTPFFSEAMFQDLRMAKDQQSVHLADWPQSRGLNAAEKKMITQMAAARTAASAALAKRAELGIKVRQPLASLTLKSGALQGVRDMLAILQEEVNVKKINFDPKMEAELEFDTNITPELKAEGILRELVRAVQELRQEAKLQPKDRIMLFLDVANVQTTVAENEEFVKKETGAKTIEYKKSDKVSAEAATKLDGKDVWLGVRKV